jgi:hypothetical protein
VIHRNNSRTPSSDAYRVALRLRAWQVAYKEDLILTEDVATYLTLKWLSTPKSSGKILRGMIVDTSDDDDRHAKHVYRVSRESRKAQKGWEISRGR